MDDQVITRVGMPFRTVCFSATKSGRAYAAQNVYPAGYKFEVDRVAARAIAAKMVKFAVSFSSRQWADKPCVHQAVSMDNCIVKTGGAIAARCRCCPYPARRAVKLSRPINLDFREDARQVFSGEMFDGKVLLRHFSLLYRLICLEPLRRVLVFGRLAYFSMNRIIAPIEIAGDIRSDANF